MHWPSLITRALLAGALILLPLPAKSAEAPRPLRVSTTLMPVSAALLLAVEMEAFKREGLNIEVRNYPLGKLALEDLDRGNLDVAGAAVTPIVNKSLVGDQIRIFTSIASSTGMIAVLARKDRGIENLRQLDGKKVGIALGTSGEFFFETMRVMHRIPKANLKIEDHSLEAMIAGMKDGSLDAVSLWEPQISELTSAMPSQLAVFYDPGLYTFTWNLTAKAETISSRRADLEKLVRALFAVADFIKRDPEKARAILIDRLGDHGRHLAKFLHQADFAPSLSQDLLVAMEAEARWFMTRDARKGAMPNFLRNIDTSILKSVRPAAVTLVR